MAIEDTFNGAKSAFMTFQALFNVLAQEDGLERALALNVKANVTTATATGQMIREQTGAQGIGIQEAATLVRNSIEQGFGIASEVTDESENKIVFKLGRCPVYEAAQEVGIDPDTIEAECCSGAVTYMSTMLKQLNPNLDYELVKCRSSAEDFSEEAVMLK